MNRTGGYGCVAIVIGGFIAVVLFIVLLVAGVQKEVDTASYGTIGVGVGLKPGVIPEQYRPLVEAAARTCPEVTAPLLAAQIQAESGWNPRAVSPANAQGLTQFIPGTWQAYGVDGNGDGVRDPFEPADAIPAQANYMCQLVKQVRENDIPGDTIDNALAGYNAGFGAVLEYQGIPPYPETQNYVRKIRGLAAEFAAEPAPLVLSAPGTWVSPMGGRITSGFGPRGGEFHDGVDIACRIGTPIGAATDGTVLNVGPAQGYGRWVRIDHGNGFVAEYGHIDTYTVAVGQRVAPGQLIATCGTEGVSTGPHLHFRLHQGDQKLDPLAFYQAKGVPFP